MNLMRQLMHEFNASETVNFINIPIKIYLDRT